MNKMIEAINKILDNMAANTEKVTESQIEKLEALYSAICKTLGISEHSQWRVDWKVLKFADEESYLSQIPTEIVSCPQNVILNVGANEMLKILTATTGSTPYSETNAKIYVGNDTTAENATQTGVIATGSNKAYASMDSGFPKVVGSTATFQATFQSAEANFKWNEFSLVNGTGANAISLNRKVQNLGEKVQGIWTLVLTILVSSI